MSDLTLEECLNSYLQHAAALIKTHGYLLQQVVADEDTLPFVYSAGRADSNLPDFIVFGSTKYGHLIKEVITKNTLVDTVATSDLLVLTLADGSRVKSRYILKRIEQAAFFKYAYAAFNPKLVSKLPVEIYQIVLSDENNLLPGEPGYSDDEQPRLWVA
jgi:hypothetical protein